MWQVLKAVTVLFTICPGLQQTILFLLVIFTKIKKIIFHLIIYTKRKKIQTFYQGEKLFFLSFQIKDNSLVVKSHRTMVILIIVEVFIYLIKRLI